MCINNLKNILERFFSMLAERLCTDCEHIQGISYKFLILYLFLLKLNKSLEQFYI
jgi:hypothetical protein